MLILTTSLPQSPGDYAGRFVHEWIEAVAPKGSRVLSPRPGPSVDHVTRHTYWSPGSLLSGQGAPEALEGSVRKGAVQAVAASGGLLAAAIRHARRGEAIVGHWLVPCGLAAVSAARICRGSAHLIAHGSDIALLERLPGGRALARVLASAASITFVSADLRARFEKLAAPRHRSAVLPMGIRPAAPDQAFARQLVAHAAGRKIIATVGRLAPIKGLATLDAALRRHPDVVWFCAGDGPLAGSFEHAEALGVVSPAQRDALLSVCDVFALPSVAVGTRQEGTPLSLLEALRSGAPTVASRVGGIPEVAGPAGCVLVPPGDAQALAEALSAALEPARSAEMRRAHQAHARAYDWGSLGPAHRAVIEAGGL